MSQGCRICQGRGKRCMFCGFRGRAEKKKVDERDQFRKDCRESEMEYLRRTRQLLIKFKMQSTGSPGVDASIIKHVGDWRHEI